MEEEVIEKPAWEISLFTPQAGERWRSTKWSSVDRAILQKGLDFVSHFVTDSYYLEEEKLFFFP